MSEAIDAPPPEANVLMRIREDDPNISPLVESFSDGDILGVHLEGPVMVWALRMPGAGWPAQVAHAEARLDRIGVDWRAAVSLRRP